MKGAVDGSSDGSPLLAVDLVDQKQPPGVVADVHRDGGKQEGPATDQPADVGDVAVGA